MARDDRATWGDRFHRFYPERELIFRSRGKVHYVPMSARVQAALTVALFVGLTWVALASVGLFVERQVIASRNAEIGEMRAQYAILADDFDAMRREFVATTQEIEIKHRQLVEAVAQRDALEQGLGQVFSELDTALGERDQAREDGAALARQLSRLESELQGTSKNSPFSGVVDLESG